MVDRYAPLIGGLERSDSHQPSDPFAAVAFSLQPLIPREAVMARRKMWMALGCLLGGMIDNALGDTLEETVVVASRVADAARTLGVSVSTLSQTDIQALGYPDLASILDTQPSVTVTVDGGLGKAAAVRIRGEEGFRTRIVLNGIAIADPSSPQVSPRIEHLLSGAVSRVEILRGPQGLLWGADAGGVILLSTLAPELETGLAAQVEGGSDEYRLASVQGRYRGEALVGSLSLARLESEGFNAREIDNNKPDRDGYENTSIHGAGEMQLTPQWSLTAAAALIKGDNEYDGCYDVSTFALIHDCEDDYEQRAWRAGVRYRGEQHHVELSLSDSQTERGFLSAGQPAYHTEGNTQMLSVLGSWQLSGSSRLTYGMDLETQELTDDLSAYQRDNTGTYLEWQQQLERLTLNAGWRRDDHDEFGEHDSWRLSGHYQLPLNAGDWSLRAAIGTGFRAPSLYEAAYNRGPFSYPPASDQALREETSRGWELGVAGLLGSLAIELVWFEQDIDREIAFDLAGYSGYLQSAGTSMSEGLELMADWSLATHWRLQANYTYNDTAQRNGLARPYRPEHAARLSLAWQNDRLQFQLTGRGTRNAVDPFQLPLDTGLTVDLTGSWEWQPGWQLEGRIENLADHQFQPVPDYRMAGRSAFVGLRVEL